MDATGPMTPTDTAPDATRESAPSRRLLTPREVAGMSEPLLQGRTFAEKIWHASEVSLGLIIIILCWETTPTWLRVLLTVIAAMGILLALASAFLDVKVARLQRKVAARASVDSEPMP